MAGVAGIGKIASTAGSVGATGVAAIAVAWNWVRCSISTTSAVTPHEPPNWRMKLIVPVPRCNCSVVSALSAEVLSAGTRTAMPSRATMTIRTMTPKVVFASVRLMR